MVGATTENGGVVNALPQIAHVFFTEWTRLHTQSGAKSQAHLSPDLLTVEIRNALTTSERTLAQTKIGRDLVIRSVGQWIDLAYPRLAGQVERLLDCYVTSTGIELEPNEGSIRVQIGLRRAPVLMM